MGKHRLWITVVVVFLVACSHQSKGDLLNSGISELENGNIRGAIVYLHEALERDANYDEARFYLAEAYLQSKRYLQAETELEKIRHRNPAYPELHLKLAQVYRLNRNFDQAIKSLETYHRQQSASSESHDLLGLVYLHTGRYKLAEKHFIQASELSPTNPLPRFHLVQSILNQKQIDRAAEGLELLLKDSPSYTPAYELLAEIHLSQKRVNDAIEVYSDLYAVNPRHIQALYMQGVLLRSRGENREAAGITDILVSRFPDDYRGLQLRGIELYYHGNHEEALVYLRRSLKDRPAALTYYYLGLNHSRLQEYELAINQYQQVLDEQPDSIQARLMLALTFLQQRRAEDCLRQTRYVLKLDPENGLAHNLIGSALLQQKNYDDALGAFNRAIEIDPTLIDAHLKLGRSYMLVGEDGLAERALVSALSAAESVLNVRLVLASHYVGNGEYDKATVTLLEGLNGTSEDALLYRLLAGIAIKQNQVETFVSYLEKAKLAEPSYLSPMLDLAAHYLETGAFTRSIAEYRSLLELHPDNVRALEGLGLTLALSLNTTEEGQVYEQLALLEQADAQLSVARYRARNGDIQEALRRVERGLEIDPSHLRLLKMQVRLLLVQDQREDAIRQVRRIEKLNPGLGTQLLVNVLITHEQYTQVIELAEVHVKKRPDEPFGYLLLASALEAKGAYAQAIAAVEQGVSACRNDAELLLRTALLYEQSGAADKALPFYRKVLKMAPRYYPGRFAYAVRQEQGGHLDSARREYARVLALNENFVPALNNLANLLVVSGEDKPKALSLALRAYRLAPDESGVLDTLGIVFLANDRPREAVGVLNRAKKMAGRNPAIRYHLGQAYLVMQQNNKARVELERALQLGPFPGAEHCRLLLDRTRG